MTLAECDEEAKGLVTRYAHAGEYCVVIRTRADGTVRMIFAQTDPAKVSCWLQQAADLVFDGPKH